MVSIHRCTVPLEKGSTWDNPSQWLKLIWEPSRKEDSYTRKVLVKTQKWEGDRNLQSILLSWRKKRRKQVGHIRHLKGETKQVSDSTGEYLGDHSSWRLTRWRVFVTDVNRGVCIRNHSSSHLSALFIRSSNMNNATVRKSLVVATAESLT